MTIVIELTIYGVYINWSKADTGINPFKSREGELYTDNSVRSVTLTLHHTTTMFIILLITAHRFVMFNCFFWIALVVYIPLPAPL